MASNDMNAPWLWPMNLGLRTSAAALSAFGAMLTGDQSVPREPAWTTPHEIALETSVLRVRVFGDRLRRPAAVIVTPYALHDAMMADIASGHSLVDTLLREGLDQLALVEWKSAGPQARYLGIDDYLLRLSAVLDDIGPPSTLIGLCQGGWLSLMLAARYPDKVSKLVLAGAPIDLDAAPSAIATAARETNPDAIRAMVAADAGLMRGRTLMGAWSARGLKEPAPADVLQVADAPEDVLQRFQAWQARPLDLPGAYYLQVYENLFRRNELARGEFQALGRVLALSSVRAPLFLIASADDEVTPLEQVMAVRHLVGTPPDQIATASAHGSHLSLFMGAQTLETVWSEAARWCSKG